MVKGQALDGSFHRNGSKTARLTFYHGTHDGAFEAGAG